MAKYTMADVKVTIPLLEDTTWEVALEWVKQTFGDVIGPIKEISFFNPEEQLFQKTKARYLVFFGYLGPIGDKNPKQRPFTKEFQIRNVPPPSWSPPRGTKAGAKMSDSTIKKAKNRNA